ncbi:MAG: leucine-rich repeat domain-containing protein [Promethearchaeota archaeon]
MDFLYSQKEPKGTISDKEQEIINTLEKDLDCKFKESRRVGYSNSYNLVKGHISKITIKSDYLEKVPECVGELSKLSFLYLNIKKLNFLPESITKLPYLKRLNIQTESFTIPENISDIKSLTSLFIRNSSLRTLPESIGKLKSLNELFLYDNRLITLPKSIGNLTSLRILRLNNNKITSLPESIGQLSELEELDIRNNNIISLPNLIVNLSKLKKFSFDAEKINILPKQWIRLPIRKIKFLKNIENYPEFIPKKEFKAIVEIEEKLKKERKLESVIKLVEKIDKQNPGFTIEKNHIIELSLNGTKIDSQLPDSFKTLKSLKYLNLGGNKCYNISESIKGMLQLKELYLSDTIEEEIPDEIYNFKLLEVLNCNHCLLEKLPDFFGNLINLKELNLGNNSLSKLPDSFKKLKALEYLNLENNRFNEFPLDIIELTNLKMLNLSGTKDESQSGNIPESIEHLQNLEELYLAYNNIFILPESIGKLSKLTRLDLSNNKLKVFPESFKKLKSLSYANLEKNPLNKKYAIFARKGVSEGINYLWKVEGIRLFLSHAVLDFFKYNIEKLVNFLEAQINIQTVFYCERDMVGDIKRSMQENIKKSDLLLFFATKQSLYNSPDCQFELKEAKANSIEILGIKGGGVSYSELESMDFTNIIDFQNYNSNLFFENLTNYINKKIEKKRSNIQKQLILEEKSKDIEKLYRNIKDNFNNLLISNTFQEYISNNSIELLDQFSKEIDPFVFFKKLLFSLERKYISKENNKTTLKKKRLKIILNKGVGDIKFNMSIDKLIKKYGTPEKSYEHGKYTNVNYPSKGFGVNARFKKINEIHLYGKKKVAPGTAKKGIGVPFEAITEEGISIDSTFKDIIEAYGKPKYATDHDNSLGAYCEIKYKYISFEFLISTEEILCIILKGDVK